ncbi:MAG: tRNA dihydrouridine synthase DusB [Acidimicrobiaceae bacterium]|jgi:nifR3 family TIM-barrel protein|nr:tRNA dihydrouridine synthase DusB [Acidimicrobiaceae bacterium]MBO64762.1 tRNA dihydrouridine synthase DusB [Actinomycetota bacterium]MCH2628422.1 tRNA dihydrouridine synthase DusB [Acidimicrobiales bacterium]MEC9115200.1 tRNA dihydrouridine synthase DusB [Actinomycetota bacterium]|tara:strand:+ start:4416 stop:5600 length:1185 start_codon:yes stop_codon:yes gene_type:complete
MTAYRSALNESLAPVDTGEIQPVNLGPIQLEVPVVLAPMAGVTDWPFRSLCSHFGAALYVNQMITARALVEENALTWKLAEFGVDEPIRSIQLYGTDPKYVSLAVHMLKDRIGVDHIDMNFGCPAPKVTKNGGGAAIPVKRRLLASIVESAVEAAGNIPVTIKFRKGIDDEHLTFLDSGRIAQESGCVGVTLHARTARDLYSGHADWDAIGELVNHIDIPVFGNGDIWESWDAVRMIRYTGAAGVEIGRGCLGRPWLFSDLVAVLSGREPQLVQPSLGLVADVMLDHVARLLDFYDHDENDIVRRFRKHAGWYVAGWPVGRDLRRRLHSANNLDELKSITDEFDRGTLLPPEGVRVKRSHTGGPRKVSLPENWLADPDEVVALSSAAEANVSGG